MKLLYFLYLAPGSRVRDDPGIKSKICKALGYKSDGHFYHDWECLLQTNMLKKEGDYFVVTDEGKEEFAFSSPTLRHNFLIIGVGMILIIIYKLIIEEILPILAIEVFGMILTLLGILLIMFAKRNEPELPFRAKVLLKKIRRQEHH
jgi:hypothetical protein